MNSLFDDLLRLPEQVLLLEAERRLRVMFPTRALLHVRHNMFRHAQFVHEGQATLKTREEFGSLTEEWPDDTMTKTTFEVVHRWDVVTWNSNELDVVTLTLREDGNTDTIYFLISDTAALARKFFLAVCSWCATVRGAVLVFQDGRFHASTTLQKTIEKASLDELVLPDELRTTLREDVTRFITSQQLYQRHKVAWKRGLLLIGPPGNGKTHTLRALIKETGWPVIYVKSFRGRNTDAEQGIEAVFSRARRAAPCVVVLEDLDCLIDDGNRSVLLNELDGFAENEGILVLASTNHPEKIDRSLLDRPSRFDRKLHFPLPAAAERRRYLEKWQQTVEVALKLSDEALTALVEGTQGFTFAYLKELTLSAMLAFMESPLAGRMDETAANVLATLKGEANQARKVLPPLPDAERRISLS